VERGFSAQLLDAIVDGNFMLVTSEWILGEVAALLEDAVYLLHAFPKKSKRGIKTPRQDIDIIKSRLKLAQEDYRARQAEKERGK